MADSILVGVGRFLIPVPGFVWRPIVRANGRKSRAGLGFMTPDHHRVRDFSVVELGRRGEPIAARDIAEQLDLSAERAEAIVAELERRLTFLYRSRGDAVTWAYPVTVDRTSHRAVSSLGEEAYSPWAIDTFAMPFVQGHLRRQPLSIRFESQCAHCGQPLGFELDDELRLRKPPAAPNPLVFVPFVDFTKLKDLSIVDSFWRKSVFFWSEEHAKQHRNAGHEVAGMYLTFAQAIWITPILQGALFDFPRSESTASRS